MLLISLSTTDFRDVFRKDSKKFLYNFAGRVCYLVAFFRMSFPNPVARGPK